MATPATPHLAKGSAFPSLKPGVLRCYSMRFCPFAQRTRLVLAHHKIPHEIINVSTAKGHKAEWFLERNPDGQVPVLEFDGKVIIGSLVCADYLDEVYGGSTLYAKDPYVRAKQKMLIENQGKLSSVVMNIMGPIEELKTNLDNVLSYFENALQDKFFGGSSPAMVDFILWPWLERMEMIKLVREFDPTPKNKFPKMAAYIDAMKATTAVKATISAPEDMLTFSKSYFAGDVPDYDFVLSK